MFMMIANHGDLVFKKVDPFHNLHANQRMLLYILILLRCQLALFLEYFIPDTDLADVMKERSKDKVLQPLLTKTHLHTNPHTHLSHPVRMASGVWVLGIDRPS